MPDFWAGDDSGENRAPCTDPGGCCEASASAARQRAVVIFATLVAFETLHRLKFALTGIATGKGVGAVDSGSVTTRPAMVSEHS